MDELVNDSWHRYFTDQFMVRESVEGRSWEKDYPAFTEVKRR